MTGLVIGTRDLDMSISYWLLVLCIESADEVLSASQRKHIIFDGALLHIIQGIGKPFELIPYREAPLFNDAQLIIF